MGELKLDLDHLHTVAAAVREAADRIAEIDWPQLDPGALPDSAISGSAAPAAIATRTNAMAARMRVWAADAQTSATALEQTESTNTDRLGR